MTRQTTIEIEKKAEQKGKIWNGDEIRRSIVLYFNASENWEKLGELKRASSCLRESAKLSFLVSEQKDAQPYLMKALQLDLKAKNIEGQVITHGLLFRFHKFNNQNNKSEFHINKAIKLSESSSFYSKAISHFILGKNKLYNGRITEADTLLTKAYGFIEKDNDTKLKAHILLNLGLLSAFVGDKDKGLKRIIEAQSLWKSIDYQRGSALVSNALGYVYVITDEKQKASKYYRHAEKLIPNDVDYEERADTYSGIASIYYHYRYFGLAEKYLSKAIELRQQTNNNLGLLGSLTELVEVQYLRGNFTESNATFKKAASLAKSVKNAYFIGLLNQHSGLIAFAEGNIDIAIKKLTKTKNSYKKLGVVIPRIDNLLGKAFEKKGDFISSRKYYASAVASSKKTKETFQLAEALNGLASLLKKEEKYYAALIKSKESINLTESFYNNANNNGLKKSFFANSFERYDLHINLLMELHNKYPNEGFDLEALKASEKSRSRLMQENLQFALSNITIDANTEIVAKEKELKKKLFNKKEELILVYNRIDYNKQDFDRLNLEINEIENELHSTQALLLKDSPIYSAIKNSVNFDIESLQKEILDERTVLLEFFFGKEKSYVWLIEKSQLNVYTLPNSSFIESKLNNLIKLIVSIEDLSQNSVAENQKQLSQLETKYWKDAKEISNLLFEQFFDKLKNKRIILVPDGKLRSFPVSAFPVPNREETTPFLLTNEIVYEPSASLLYILKTKRKKQTSPKKDFLVFSDPIFSKNDKRLIKEIKTLRGELSKNEELPLWTNFDSLKDLEKLGELKESKKESNNIFRFFDPMNSKRLSGFDANRDNLLIETSLDYKVIHFATHGLFNERIPELSGIVLSRYNKKGVQQKGLILLQDIYSMRLSTDLVVLSACDTGVGVEVKGEGLISLTNGFLQVGAKSIISSRWKVEDNKTAELMSNFYQFLAEEDITPSRALQKAKIKMYKNPNNSFPFYWASFTFHGDFQNKPNLSTKSYLTTIFNYANYLLFFFLAISLIGIYILVRKHYKQNIT